MCEVAVKMNEQATEKSEAKDTQGEAEFKQFLFEGGRGPKRGTREMLVAQHLTLSTFTIEKPKIIHHVTSAAMHLEPKEAQKLDLELMKGIFLVNECLSHPHIQKQPLYYYPRTGWTYRHIYKIVWGFPATEENFKKFIKPWYNNLEYFRGYMKLPTFPTEYRLTVVCPKCAHVLFSDSESNIKNTGAIVTKILGKYGERKTRIETVDNPAWNVDTGFVGNPLMKAKVKYWVLTCPSCKTRIDHEKLTVDKKQVARENPKWLYFFTASQFLTELGSQVLWRSFVGWAYPKVMKAKAILSNFVTPQLLKEISESLSGKQPKEKEPKIP